MAAAPFWNPKAFAQPLVKRKYTDEEVAWWSARVKYYLHEKNADMTRAMDRASYDLKNRTML